MADRIFNFVVPVIGILFLLVVGILLDKFVLLKFSKKWKKYDIINPFKRMIIVWSLLLGLIVLLPFLPIKKHILEFLNKTIVVLIVASVAFVLSKLTANLIRYYTENISLPRVSIFEHIAKFFIWIIGLLIILQMLGVSVTPLVTAFGLGGLAVALALQDTLSNFFAGLHIIISKQIRPGDYVKLESGEEGYVENISWRVATIRQLSNNIVMIPNLKLSSNIIVNYHLPETDMAVLVNVGVSYDSDLDKVERVTVEVAKEVMMEVKGGVPEFEPFIRYHSFGDFSINFTVILRVREFTDQYLVKHEFIKKLYKRYKREGIEIPFPIRTLYIEKMEGTNKNLT